MELIHFGELLLALQQQPRAPLALLPTPVHRLGNFGPRLGLPDLWIKRDDLTGLEGGGNKTRKLEFLVGDAIQAGADMLIPAGASEHRLGSFGYMGCAAELVRQSKEQGVRFDYIVHCTGSSSTQAGLVAGFAFMSEDIRVIGVADDHETDIKRGRVLELANNALAELDSSVRVTPADVEIISADQSAYGEAESETFDLIRLLAACEGLVADPVYEGKALRGLQALAADGRFESGSRVLLMHLGGTPAVHAYATKFGKPEFTLANDSSAS